VLSPRAATLAGTVKTPRGAPVDASIVLISEDSPAWHDRSTATRRTAAGDDGSYRFDGLRTGRYLVLATPREDGHLASLTPDDFELIARHATRVTIEEAEAKSLDLKRVRIR
jgi:hypothetical protein